ncbi:amidohydrolase family protein [Fusibacter paucivorans]|uniref:Amidohydrolase family protein n=1 Tax=Fusibacter paucivorans TaxID=76009 RepID=A0ABS5PLZ7_9FIRM|nr:amidohydrolase family protein [Fusibacter paucivorans]MBS7525381.1 amidohydrolase family protein [Fusibacter paucivorans]
MILIQNTNVLTMQGDEVLENVDVLTDKGKIIKLVKHAPNYSEKDVRIVKGEGRYLMPSLFDAHAHLNSSEMSYLFIANGITGIRHLSGGEMAMAFAASIERGEHIGPNVYASGPIYDGSEAIDKSPTYRYIATKEEAIKAVDDTIAEGYRWVKTYPAILPEHLEALMAHARERGIKVCGHMSYHVDHKTLCDWGYHCCEHSSSLPNDPESIAYLAEAGMWFCPTQVVCETLPDYVWNRKKLTDLPHYEYVPQKIRDFWEAKNEKIIEGYKRRGMKPDINVVINRGKTFMAHSKRVMAGSDTMYPGMIAGFSLHDELYKLVHLYGQTNGDVLRMATVNPAAYIGLSDCKGQVRVGFDSDLLLLNGNPLEDITATQKIEGVMKGETYYDRSALDDLLKRSQTEPVDFFERLF